MIMISGASGALGSLVADRLKDLENVILGTRSPERATVHKMVRHIDFEVPTSLANGFDGVDVLLLISAGYGEDNEVIARHDRAISAAERASVGHIVYTSLTGAGDHLAFALPHRWTEKRLQESTAKWTILRNGIYAEMSVADAAQAASAGRLVAPLGDGRLAAVAREDLADVAAAIIADPSRHERRIYELVGDEAIGGAEIAASVSAVVGKEVPYVPSALAELREALASAGVAAWQIPIIVSTYSSISAGFMDETGGDLRSLLGRPPRPALDVIARAIS